MSLRLPAAVFLLSSFVSARAAPQTETALEHPDIRVQTADHSLVSRIVEESGATTVAPRPGAVDYVAELTRRVMNWITRRLAPMGRYVGVLGNAFGRASSVVVVLVAVLLVFLFGRFLHHRLHPGPDAEEPRDVLVAEREPPAAAFWSSADWQQALRDRLDRSDVAGSLEALWWWLARSVLGSRVTESWTSRDLLASAQRPDLSEPVRTLERMMYGCRRPSPDEVRELARSLEEQLA